MKSAGLAEEDVRAMVRLLGEVGAGPGDHVVKKRQLMDGLGRLIGADFWVWALGASLKAGEQPVYTAIMHNGFAEDQFRFFLNAVEHPDMIDMFAPFAAELAQKRSHLTRARQQIVPAGVFESRPVWRLWERADIGPILMSYRPIDSKSCSCIAIYRRFSRPLFNQRETRIAHILLTEVPWLHFQGWPEDRGQSVPQLTKRQRQILNLLICGHPRKAIAASLGISEHTTNDHVKDIYRHFAVHSQIELANRFFQGNGGDVP
jgi:DNA-binding CsgD family transcriptional regulator